MEHIEEKQALEQLEKGYDGAQTVLKNPDQVELLLQRLEAKLRTLPKVGEKLSTLPVFASMVKSYISGEYKEVPIGTIVAIVSALIYFISPIDLIPDAIPGVGYLDDAAVIGACLLLVESDVKEYAAWRSTGKLSAGE